MTEEQINEIYTSAGLIFTGINYAGEAEYLGTKKEWERADRLLQAQLLEEQGEVK